MDNSSVKRPLRIELPTPEDLATIFGLDLKRQKLDEVPKSLQKIATSTSSSTSDDNDNLMANIEYLNSISKNPLPPPFLPTPSNNYPQNSELNSVPPNILPIIKHPLTVSDFYTDLDTTVLSNPNVNYQVNQILNRFPPPYPPSLKKFDENGVLIPFIYPPPPKIKPDFDKEQYLHMLRLKRDIITKMNNPQPQPQQQNATSPSPEQQHAEYHQSRESPSLESQSSAYQPSNYSNEVTPTPAGQSFDGGELDTKSSPSRPMDEQLEPPSHPALENYDNYYYPAVPPLPFPPANFMPYILRTDQASLTPHEVFNKLLKASNKLPRIDMVVASAAGSLFDIKNQAHTEGFSSTRHESQARRHDDSDEYDEYDGERNEDDEYDSSGSTDGSSSELVDEDLEDYIHYAQGIDTSEAYDYYYTDEYNKGIDKAVKNTVVVNQRNPDYDQIEIRTSKNGKIIRGKRPIYDEYEISGDKNQKFVNRDTVRTNEVNNNGGRDIISANSNNRERRREELKQSVQNLEDFATSHRREIYLSKKRQLLTKLRNLRESNIGLSDDKTILKDDDLKYFADKLRSKRDDELLRLKFYSNYESLKASMSFYEDSNKYYKSMNSTMTNKLLKLKNFFEFQRTTFNNLIKNFKNGDIPESFDIKNKESLKLFNGISKQDYNTDIKEILKKSANDDELVSMKSISHQSPEFLAALASKKPSGFTTEDLLSSNLVIHDFMPLVTTEEFNLITGDLPNKIKSMSSKESSSLKTKHAINIKHQIFQSPLYDPNSGSDSNSGQSGSNQYYPNPNGHTSDSATSSVTTTKRRPGRRSNASIANGEGFNPDRQHTEAALLAKIMKQFIGPLSVKNEELTNDLEMMGIETKWPIGK